MGSDQIQNRFEDLPQLEKLPPNREWVYFLEGRFPQPLIKIGHSQSLKKRLVSLQAQIPVQLKLIAAVNGPAGSEFVLHKVFDAERAHCEWFRPSEFLLATASAMPRGGRIDGEDLLAMGAARGLDEKQLRLLFWNGIRRVERGMKVPGESKRKRPLERLVLDGYRF